MALEISAWVRGGDSGIEDGGSLDWVGGGFLLKKASNTVCVVEPPTHFGAANADVADLFRVGPPAEGGFGDIELLADMGG